MNGEQLRHELQHSDDQMLTRRRAIIGWSLFGIANMSLVALFQTGVIKHLPDPPIAGFNSDKVNSSRLAYKLGVPDGALSLASLAINIPLAAFGGRRRAQTQPWLPILIAGKAALEAVVAGWYFYQMPKREKAWCAYCIFGAVANAAIFAYTLPEAKRAVASL